jgi:uncharacterized membrane protein
MDVPQSLEPQFPIADPQSQRSRLLWLDGFRGMAVLLMIQTHVVNTFLARNLRDPVWFGWLDYINGIVAPSFLFIAGFAVGLGMRAGPGKPVAFGRKARRLLEILALGYALHFPFTELFHGRWEQAWLVGTQVDVLPCIAVALAVLLGVQWFAQRFTKSTGEWVWTGMLAALIGMSVIGAQWMQSWKDGPAPLVAYANQTTGSLFPLLPWAAFVFAGAWRGSTRGSREPAQGVGWRFPLLWLGLGCAAAWWRGHSVFSPLAPAFFVERLAWVLLAAEACQAAPFWNGRYWVRLAGRESLWMYAGHLVVISAFTSAGIPEASLDFPSLGMMFLVVLAIAFAIALGKERWPQAFFQPGPKSVPAPVL